MKHGLYELFSEYRGELPEIEESPCDAERIKQLALQGRRKKTVNIRRKSRVLVISIAAAVAAMTGITAAAYTDAFGRFRSILRRTEPGPVINSELPLMHGDDTEGMEENISEERVVFTGSDSMEVSTAGMYYDNNTLMLSVEMKLNEDIEIPDKSLVVPRFVRRKNGVETELSGSGIGNAAVLVKGDEPDSYYATFYVTNQDMAGSTVEVCLENIIDSDQPWNIQKRVLEEQAKWREEYGADNMTIEEWKQLWKEKELDQRTRDFDSKCLDECEKVLVGSWTAQISIPADISKTMTAEKHGFRITADTLSITFDSSRDIPFGDIAVPVITMKDGTVISTTGTNEMEWLIENGVCTSSGSHEEFAYRLGNIYSYSRPHSVEDIADISVYVFGYENGDIRAECYTIYVSEGEN